MLFSLFVKNFPPGTTEEELTLFFKQASQGGEVTKVAIIPGTQQAFVNFSAQDTAKAAREYARNVLFKHQFPIYAEYCYPKEMRTMKYEEKLDQKAFEKRKAEK